MTIDPSAGSDLAPLPAQQILAPDLNLLDHRLVLSSFSHDIKIDTKAAEIKTMKNESWRMATDSFINCLSLKAEKLNFVVGYVIS